jgi:hypothetical protein
MITSVDLDRIAHSVGGASRTTLAPQPTTAMGDRDNLRTGSRTAKRRTATEELDFQAVFKNAMDRINR